MVETDKKRDQIIEGAIKRFIHFGINKTTMNEIADDLSVSKPSLYYYFPDKTSLIIGVLDKVFNDFFEIVDKELDENANIEKTLLNLIEVGHRFFQKYYMLHLSGGSPDSSLNSPEVRNHIMEMKKRNQALHARIFQKAAEKGEIVEADLDKIADLYLASQSGITSLCIMQGNKDLFPGKKELKDMLEKQMHLCQIFLQGLKNNNQ
ncbi:MAG: TetR family transcriptional regulator [Pedobacter sp.]|jgi:AcrR family transcriptional regulator|nr:TetR family transcriptional regulator [Pedobacter sp.]